MKSSFENDLQKIGLSEKEAKVYLASLTIGQAPVQAIAEAAGVKRATTYVMIESLLDRGLMSSVVKGKKTYFFAENPKQLKKFVSREKERLQKKEILLEDLVPQLGHIIVAAGEKPEIKMFEGTDGLEGIHSDIISSTKKGEVIENFAAVDAARVLLNADDLHGHWNTLAKKRVSVRVIYTAAGKAEKIPAKFSSFWKERRVDETKFPFNGEVVIYGNKIAALSFKGRLVGVIIESKEIAQTFHMMFALAWAGAEKVEIK